MGKKGKGRKRRESNFKASHDVKEMAPPPITKDINAVPAKLRRIMQFRETGNPGSVNLNTGADIGLSKKQVKDSIETRKENRNVKEKKDEAPGTSAPNDSKLGKVDGQIAENASKPSSKRKRENEELLQLAEKIKAHPVKTKINDRKKKFLEEKKKKRLSNAVVQALMNAPKKDHVAFGEVVQAPPQLTFPEKNKLRVKEAKPASMERVRLQVIEAYRQRKGTKTGLERGLPVLVPTTDETT